MAALISGTDGFRSIGSYYSMEAALAALVRQQPHVMLTDIGLPGMSGIDGIEILRERCPQVAILALTVYDNDNKIFNALCAGASGYLLKNTPPARLLESIKEVVKGGAPMSLEVARRVIRFFRELRPPESAAYHLTAQETELLNSTYLSR